MEAILDLILRAQAHGTEAFTAVSKELAGVGSAGKGAAKDAEKLAESGGKGGVLGNIASGALGMVSPLMLATAGVGALAAVGGAAFNTWKEDEVSIKALDTALRDHGINVQSETSLIEANANKYADLGYTIEQVRPAFTQLTEAGLNQNQQMAAMGPIMDLARAKNIDLTTAAQQYTMAMMGSGRALKNYGILLPPVAASAADVGKATANLTKAHQAATLAEEQLTVTEDALKGKHTLTAAEALKLQQAHDKVTTAEQKVKDAQAALTLAQQGGIDKAARLKLVNDALNKAIGDQRGSADALAGPLARLSNDWEHFSEKVGPLVEGALSAIMTGASDLFDFLDSTAIPALTEVWTWFDKLPAQIQYLINPIGMLFAHLGDVVRIVEMLIGDLQKVAGIIPGVVNSISKIPGVGLIGSAGSAVGGLLSKLPGFAIGGTVPGMPGQLVPILAHGGEQIGTPGAPLSGSGGAVFHPGSVVVNGAQDPAATAQAVMLEIKRQLTRQSMSYSGGF